MEKKISIIIPTYKPADYLLECLSSIKNQTLNSSKYEVLIVLNGEKEPYSESIKQHIEGKDNYRLIYTEKLGVSNARNVGIKESINEYICFIDDDDFISENYLKELLEIVDEETVAVANLLTVKEVNEKYEYGEDYITKAFKTKSKIESQNLFKMRKFLSNACGKLIHKNIIEKTIFNENFKLGEDSLFMCEISKNIKNMRTTGVEVIYYRRTRENSASRKKRSETENVENRKKLIKEYLRMLKNRKYSKILVGSRIAAVIKGLI